MVPAPKPSDILEAAAKLIEPEGAWTRAFCARDACGSRTEALSPDAVCWCILGAVAKAAGRDSDPYCPPELGWITAATGGSSFSFNDAEGRTQAQVVTVLRKAAELARSEGQ